jgi:hypothetical protein
MREKRSLRVRAALSRAGTLPGMLAVAASQTFSPGRKAILESGCRRGDPLGVHPLAQAQQLKSRCGLPVYECRFSYVARSLRSTAHGAPHGREIPFLFDTVGRRHGKDLSATDEAAAAMHACWLTSAHTDRPACLACPRPTLFLDVPSGSRTTRERAQ